MPHSQIGVEPDPVVDRELRRQAYALPGVLDRPSVISVAGARALWLADDVDLLRPETILRGREFAHFHPDGSLHATLPPDRGSGSDRCGLGRAASHCRAPGNGGARDAHTPRTLEEMAVVMALDIRDSYNFVTGRAIVPPTDKVQHCNRHRRTLGTGMAGDERYGPLA